MVNNNKFNKIISRRFSKNKITLQTDFVAVESPLEICLSSNGVSENVTVLMRTPGDDEKLIRGFLLTEGLLDIDEIKKSELIQNENKLNLNLFSKKLPDFSELKRNFIANSSCGICGKASVDEILRKIPKKKESIETHIDGLLVQKICEEMSSGQELFMKTGGVHAIGLFTKCGQIICLEEDVGRHNAMDKVIGNAFFDEKLKEGIVGACLSGRASYEMVQKAAMVGLEVLICIGAPTSLAIDLAVACSITLIGFVSKNKYNIYTCEQRILSTIN